MSTEKYWETKMDCAKVTDELVAILKQVMGNEVDFLVYGAYLGIWRNGLSDLDGMIYFRNSMPLYPSTKSRMFELRAKISQLYEKFPFLKKGKFLADIFMLDYLHGSDGRFMIFDSGFFRELKGKYNVVYGEDFIKKLNPVSLRMQEEFQLAIRIQRLRHYFIFETLRPAEEMSWGYAEEVLKYLRALARDITFILNNKMISDPRALIGLRSWLSHIDFLPIICLWENTNDPQSLDKYLESWHDAGRNVFIDCLECYEKTLEAVVRNSPMKSRY